MSLTRWKRGANKRHCGQMKTAGNWTGESDKRQRDRESQDKSDTVSKVQDLWLLAVVAVDGVDCARIERNLSLVEYRWEGTYSSWRIRLPVERRDPVHVEESFDD
jgi:hypothetical protein